MCGGTYDREVEGRIRPAARIARHLATERGCHFLQERVKPHAYGDLTVTEIVEGYAAFCPERRWHTLPITEVQNKLEGLMLELFGVTKSHDIKRRDKNQRGFSRVTFSAAADGGEP